MSFPYWPGEVLQILEINGNNLSIVPGNTVVLPSGGAAVSSFTDASISSLTVSSINGLPPGTGTTISSFTDLYAQLGSISSLTVSSINGQVPGTGTQVSTFNDLTTNQLNASSITTSTLTVNTLVALSTISALSTLSSINLEAQTATISSLNANTFNTSSFTAANGSFSTLNVGLLSTPDIVVSSINGVEFTPQQIIVSTLNTDAINTNSMSSLVSYVGQQLVSTIQFNPAVNISPQFNIDMNMGGFLTTLGSGLFGIAVAVPTTVGTLTYGLTKGLASLFEPRPINNINNNVFETFNYASQLQVSTLGEQISTIYRFTSTIPSTIVINTSNINSTISQTDVEIFVSTLSQSSNPTCIRAVADPVQIVSTPWTVFQGFGEWVEIPGGGGLSNIPSTINLSTLVLSPSTILKGDLTGSVLEVLENQSQNDYGEVKAAGYWTQLSNTDPNFGIYARNSSNIPTWIDSNFTPNPFALQNKQVAFSEVDFPVKDGNQSTITNLFINNSAEPSLTYALYPPGFPSTTAAQIKFLSTANGGVGGVQILSQLGEAKSLTVNGSGVLASDIITGSNSDYPLLVQVPNLDQFVLLGLSTLNGGVGKTEILNTLSTNQGQLIIAAPNTSNNGSTRIMYLDSASTCVGINNTAPQAQLDVGTGLNYTSPGSVGIFAGNRDGTLELTLQNQSAGSNASAFFFAVENTGAEYAGFGINSANLAPVYNTLTEIPGASVQSGTIDIVIAPQSDHSSNAGIFLGYNDATFAHHINSNGALSFNASYTGGTINPGSFGNSNSVLITNGAGAAPSWTNSPNLVNTTVSTLTVGSNITWPETQFAAPKVFLQGGTSNSPVINTNVIASPYIDTLTFYKGFTNQDFPGGFICLAADNGLMGVNKIPDANIDLDVNGIICASNISTPQISTTQLGATSANISSIKQAINTEAVPYTRCPLTVAQNFDYFGSSYGHFNGTQSVVGGYFINLNNSIGGGHAEGDFIFPPPGLSSMMTCQATYFITNSNAPQTPTWVGNMTIGANGQISTIQVFGDAGEDVYVSYIGFV